MMGTYISTSNERSDACLIDAAVKGDDEAFCLLVARHKNHVFKLAAYFACDSYELDDICQEVFIKVYENLSRFRHDAPFKHWLSRIAVNACRDALRRRRRTRGHLSLEDVTFENADHGWETVRSAREAYEFLMQGMKKLNPDERIVMTLIELEEKSVRDVAALTGWSEVNVRVRAHRARQKLRKILEAHDESKKR